MRCAVPSQLTSACALRGDYQESLGTDDYYTLDIAAVNKFTDNHARFEQVFEIWNPELNPVERKIPQLLTHVRTYYKLSVILLNCTPSRTRSIPVVSVCIVFIVGEVNFSCGGENPYTSGRGELAAAIYVQGSLDYNVSCSPDRYDNNI